MTSINDLWRAQNSFNLRAKQIKQQNNYKEKSIQYANNFSDKLIKVQQMPIPASQMGQSRNYDMGVAMHEYLIERENVMAHDETEEGPKAYMGFEVNPEIANQLIKNCNALIREQQQIFVGTTDASKITQIFKLLNDLSFFYNQNLSDISKDIIFSRTFHSKVIQIESLFQKMKVRFEAWHQESIYKYNSYEPNNSYPSAYVVEIINTALKVCELMLDNKDTSVYVDENDQDLESSVQNTQLQYEPLDNEPIVDTMNDMSIPSYSMDPTDTRRDDYIEQKLYDAYKRDAYLRMIDKNKYDYSKFTGPGAGGPSVVADPGAAISAASAAVSAPADPLEPGGVTGVDAVIDPDSVDPDAVDPDAVDPDAVDPDAVDPDAVDPDADDPDAVDAPDGPGASESKADEYMLNKTFKTKFKTATGSKKKIYDIYKDTVDIWNKYYIANSSPAAITPVPLAKFIGNILYVKLLKSLMHSLYPKDTESKFINGKIPFDVLYDNYIERQTKPENEKPEPIIDKAAFKMMIAYQRAPSGTETTTFTIDESNIDKYLDLYNGSNWQRKKEKEAKNMSKEAEINVIKLNREMLKNQLDEIDRKIDAQKKRNVYPKNLGVDGKTKPTLVTRLANMILDRERILQDFKIAEKKLLFFATKTKYRKLTGLGAGKRPRGRPRKINK